MGQLETIYPDLGNSLALALLLSSQTCSFLSSKEVSCSGPLEVNDDVKPLLQGAEALTVLSLCTKFKQATQWLPSYPVRHCSVWSLANVVCVK